MSVFDWIRIIIAFSAVGLVLLLFINNLSLKKKVFTTKMIAATGILTAIEIVLQIAGNFIAIGPVSINLSLIPIVLGAILYGPVCGAFLGFINGVSVLFAPSTLAIFMPINPIATIFICILKSTLAGLIAGLIYLPFKNKHQVPGSILAAMSVPVINTGLFAIGSLIFFKPFLEAVAVGFPNIYVALLLGVIGWNFVFEFAVNTIFSPGIARIVKVIERRKVVA